MSFHVFAGFLFQSFTLYLSFNCPFIFCLFSIFLSKSFFHNLSFKIILSQSFYHIISFPIFLLLTIFLLQSFFHNHSFTIFLSQSFFHNLSFTIFLSQLFFHNLTFTIFLLQYFFYTLFSIFAKFGTHRCTLGYLFFLKEGFAEEIEEKHSHLQIY